MSMSPTILPGDYVFVEKVSFMIRDPVRGEVVLFKSDAVSGVAKKRYYLARITGVPGDFVAIGVSNVVVNGERQAGTGDGGEKLVVSREGGARCLDAAEYFALGDNEMVGLDSRQWGVLPQRNIVGRVVWLFRCVNHRGLRVKAPYSANEMTR